MVRQPLVEPKPFVLETSVSPTVPVAPPVPLAKADVNTVDAFGPVRVNGVCAEPATGDTGCGA